jgi:hypothetical protein
LDQNVVIAFLPGLSVSATALDEGADTSALDDTALPSLAGNHLEPRTFLSTAPEKVDVALNLTI